LKKLWDWLKSRRATDGWGIWNEVPLGVSEIGIAGTAQRVYHNVCSLNVATWKTIVTLTIQLPEELEAVLKAEANAHGVSPANYARDILERELAASLEKQTSGPPLKTGWGLLAKFGPAPSAEEIDANRAEMFRHFAEE